MGSHIEIQLDGQAGVVTLTMKADEPPEVIGDQFKETLGGGDPGIIWFGTGVNRVAFRASAVLSVEIKPDRIREPDA